MSKTYSELDGLVRRHVADSSASLVKGLAVNLLVCGHVEDASAAITEAKELLQCVNDENFPGRPIYLGNFAETEKCLQIVLRILVGPFGYITLTAQFVEGEKIRFITESSDDDLLKSAWEEITQAHESA